MTAKAGVGDPGFSTSAVWVDYDKDGKLDLLVANYVDWTLEKDLFCSLDGKTKSYCTPESYKGAEPDALSQPRQRHVRGRHAQGRALRSVVEEPRRRACSTTTATAGRISSSPTTRSRTSSIATRRTARSKTSATTAGVAFNEAGVARAGMGVDAADYDGSGRPSLVIGNFSNEMMALYTNEGNGLFIDEAPIVARSARPRC